MGILNRLFNCCNCKERKNKNEKEAFNEVGMTANPLFNMSFDMIEVEEVANEVDNEKRDRPKLNRKSKGEINEEFYNHSKDALQDLDDYLSQYSFGFLLD